MSLWSTIMRLVIARDEDQEQEDRSFIRREIRELRTTREQADVAIDALQRQAETAVQQYRAGRPDLAEHLREARRHVARPARGGRTS